MVSIKSNLNLEPEMNHLSANPILQVENLTLGYRRSAWFGTSSRQQLIIRDISFAIQPNETVALVGQSGVGKTSIANSILRFLKPWHGNIYFLGQNIWQIPASRFRLIRPRLQPIFQDSATALNPMMTIDQAIMDGMKHLKLSHAEAQQRLNELLQMVELEPALCNHYPRQLSGGQRQRVVIARALATEPSLLILDEPLSALDLVTAVQIIDLLRSMRQRLNLSCLLITHDLMLAQQLADRIIVLKDGVVIDSGPTQQILTNPSHHFTRQLIHAAGILNRKT